MLGGLADEHRLEHARGVDGVDLGGDFELVADGDLEAFAEGEPAVPVEGETVVEAWRQWFAADGFVHAMMLPTVRRQMVFCGLGNAQAPWKDTARWQWTKSSE